MGIDIYARWKGQSNDEKEALHGAREKGSCGHVGYLFEAYYEQQYATESLVSQAFEASPETVAIPAYVLRQRLPTALALAEERIRNESWFLRQREVAEAAKQYTAFVELCERMEKETGTPVSIEVDW